MASQQFLQQPGIGMMMNSVGAASSGSVVKELDTSQTLHSPRNIRIVVAPLGNIAKKKFQEYKELLEPHRVVELNSVSKLQASTNNTFLYLQWKADKIHFEFWSPEVSKSDWEELYSHRKVHGVIGVIHCPETPNLKEVYNNEFHPLLARFPYRVHQLCLAFDPLPSQPDLEQPGFVMIPNSSREKLLEYISTLMNDFSAYLMREFEKKVAEELLPEEQGGAVPRVVESNPKLQLVLFTPFDQMGNQEDINRIKKFRQGRLYKAKGDYCLLSGSPDDAIRFYNQAISQTKSNSDLVWQAAALDGYCCAHVMSLERAHKNSFSQDVIEKFYQIFDLYDKSKARVLQIEACLKFARYQLEFNNRTDANYFLAAAYNIGNNNFQVETKILLTDVLAELYKRMGHGRKYAYYIRETAILFQKLNDYETAHLLLCKILSSYYVDFKWNQTVIDHKDVIPAVHSRKKMSVNNCGWPFLKIAILSDLIENTKSINIDHQFAVNCTVFLIKSLQEYLPPPRQQKLAESLQLITQNLPWIGCDLGLVEVKKLTPQCLPPHLHPHPLHSEKKPKDIFIFSPYQKKEVKKIEVIWVQNQVCEVLIELSNPYHFDIFIESISLSTFGTPFISHPVSVKLPANQQSISVSLSGKAGEPGTLYIKGCYIRCFNISSEHLIGPTGEPLDPNFLTTEDAENPEATAFSVRVISELPVLHVQETFAQSSSLTLFEGERINTTLLFKNAGSLSIESLQVNVKSSSCNESEANQFLSFNIQQMKFPIKPTEQRILPVSIFAFLTKVSTIEMGIQYGTSEYLRKTLVPFNFVVSKGPHVDKITAISASHQFHRNLSSLTSLPAPPSSLPLPLSPSPSTAGAHHSILSQSTSSTNRYAVDSQGMQKFLVVEVVNPTSKNFEIVGKVKQSDDGSIVEDIRMLLPQLTVKRLLLPIQEHLLPEELLKKVKLSTEIIPPSKKYKPPTKEELYRNELSKYLNLWWYSSNNTKGELTLAEAVVSSEVSTRLVRSSLSFDFRVLKSAPFDPSASVSASASASASSEEQNINITAHQKQQLVISAEPYARFFSLSSKSFHTLIFLVSNTFTSPLSLKLHIQPYQDIENGIRDTDLAHKVIWVGSLDFTTPQLEPQATHRQQVTVNFLAGGRYKIAFGCEILHKEESTPQPQPQPQPQVQIQSNGGISKSSASLNTTSTTKRPVTDPVGQVWVNYPIIIEVHDP